MTPKNNRPIGLFDSGVGGLTLLSEMEKLMPGEDFIYVADTAFTPYGQRDEADILRLSRPIVDYLISRDCKQVVVACNTVSGILGDEIIAQYGVPIVGMINYGSVSAALYVTYNFRIGVWATRRTVESGLYSRIMSTFDPSVPVFAEDCGDVIPAIENGEIGAPSTRKIAAASLAPFRKQNIDTLILGCTHLPFIKRIVQDTVGVEVTIIDPARRTAVLCGKNLADRNLLSSNRKKRGRRDFFATADPERFTRIASILLNRPIDPAKPLDLPR